MKSEFKFYKRETLVLFSSEFGMHIVFSNAGGHRPFFNPVNQPKDYHMGKVMSKY